MEGWHGAEVAFALLTQPAWTNPSSDGESSTAKISTWTLPHL